MSVAIDGLNLGWKKNVAYMQALVGDLDQAQMMKQPCQEGAPANHPAWILSHLNAYIPVIESLIVGKEFEDPKEYRFGMKSKPESREGIYQSKQELLSQYVEGHARVESLLNKASDDVLEQLVVLPRWKDVMPKVGIALPFLMLSHENMHLGQLSAWRRVQGMPSV